MQPTIVIGLVSSLVEEFSGWEVGGRGEGGRQVWFLPSFLNG